jgi:hypothetical protein
MGDTRVRLPLLLLRLGVFVVMLVWVGDKFFNPGHTAQVLEGFFFMKGVSTGTIRIIGAVELVVIVGFLLGFLKRFTYGAVLVLHALSTLAPFKLYLAPYEGPNILFFAAWPMLAACFALYYLRDQDTMMSIGKS